MGDKYCQGGSFLTIPSLVKWGKGNLTAADEFLAKDIVDHNPFPGQAPGIEGQKQLIQMFHAGFDIHIAVEDLVAEGDKIVDRWTA